LEEKKYKELQKISLIYFPFLESHSFCILFTFAEQQELAAGIRNSRLRKIDSSEGHDAFLLEFEQVNAHLIDFMEEVLPDIMGREPDKEVETVNSETNAPQGGIVSEVDDITAW